MLALSKSDGKNPSLNTFYLIILFNLSVPTLLSPVGDPLSVNKRVWFTESHIIHVISLFTQFIPVN
jgi:hypothetical protein